MTTHGEFYNALLEHKGGVPEPLHETTGVLTYEVGRMMEQAMYMHWASDDAERKTRRGFYKSEVIDAIAQLILICEGQGWSFEEMAQMGIEKAMERFIGKELK